MVGADNDTIVAIATATGRAAVGIVRLSGIGSLRIAEKICHKPLTPRFAHFSNFKDTSGKLIDQGLALYFPAPASYTGEDIVELQTHGSSLVLQQLQSACVAAGARLARAGEFTERAFLNGKIDLVQAEAVADLIDALTEQGAASANESLSGAFSQSIHELQDRLTDARVLAEGLLDFPEEETGQEADRLSSQITNVIEQAKQVKEKAGRQALFHHGATAVILGRPNVGKSSLLNRLVEKDAAIVTPIAGTTRDRLEQVAVIDGVALRFIDTAGIHQTEDLVEQAGIERSIESSKEANFILWVDDASQQAGSFVKDEIEIPAGSLCVHINNKIDMTNAEPRLEIINDMPTVYLSAKTGIGMDLLIQWLSDSLKTRLTGEGAQQLRSRQLDALRRTIEYAVLAQSHVDHKRRDLDLAAEDLRCAQQCLSEVTGEYLPDDLLGEIFSRFCIGK